MKKSKENKEYFAFLQTEFGHKLSRKEKATALKYRKSAAKLNKQCQLNENKCINIATKNPSQNLIFRYITVACLTAVLCLSVVLPITLTLSPLRIYVPTINEPEPNRRFYTDDISSLPISEIMMRDLDFLLFSKEQTFFDLGEFIGMDPGEFVFQWGESSVEFAENIILSYVIFDLFTLINDEDMFFIDFRIRTYKEYIFLRHTEHNYHALETIALKYKNILTEDIQTFITQKDIIVNDQVIDTIDIEIKAFILDNIEIFLHINTNDFGITEAFIHFTFEENDYFIRLDDKELTHKTLDINYIQNTFLPALFKNIPSPANHPDAVQTI